MKISLSIAARKSLDDRKLNIEEIKCHASNALLKLPIVADELTFTH